MTTPPGPGDPHDPREPVEGEHAAEETPGPAAEDAAGTSDASPAPRAQRGPSVPHDEDALWRSIVENYGERVRLTEDDRSSGEHPSRGDHPSGWSPRRPGGRPARDRHDGPGPTRDERPEGSARPAEDAGSAHPVDPVTPAGRGASEPTPEEPEEHFVPPPPPPVPRATPPRLLAWTGLFGVPVVVLVALVVGYVVPSWLGFLLTVWFVGGFVYLVASMRPGPREEDDDGAVL